MSLDVYLNVPGVCVPAGSGLFVRENGATREITRGEWDKRHPDCEPAAFVQQSGSQVFESNITHNLGPMARAAGVYDCCWRPDGHEMTKALHLIRPLRIGIAAMETDPGKFRAMNPDNGWGNYGGLLRFCRDYLEACLAYPDADVTVSR